MTSCVPLSAEMLEAISSHPRLLKFIAADLKWSEHLKPPATAEHLAMEAVFVICNSGMKNTVARRIFDKVFARVQQGGSAHACLRHIGKAQAIDYVWHFREEHFARFKLLKTDEERIAWCASLPWIGNITKYHLAKNLGVDCAKPDVHLQRLADLHRESVDGLCRRLAVESRLRVATVDLILWRACAVGAINSRTGEIA